MTDLAALTTNRLDAATADAGLPVGDQDLLARYLANREEGAFARLVERHGRTVWGVCRRVLHHEQDVEDAFQAVFIILARKAALIRRGEAVGSWLYRVAYRTATKAKLRAAKARSETRHTGIEVETEAKREDTPWGQAACRELQHMLDEELQNLPEKLRAPFVLCCLEGMSKSEAAQELGCKEGTVSNRLALARKQLHWRLARRGVTLSAILIAIALVQNSASAAVPAVMMHAAAVPVVGQAMAVSPSAAALAEVMLPTVGAAKLSAGVSVALAASVLLAGVGLVALQPDGGPGKVQQEEAIIAADPENFMQPASALVAPLDEQVLTLGFSPDGKRLVTAGARHIHPGQIKIWDVVSRSVIATVKGVPGVRSLAMSPTGEAFATGDSANFVRIRDAHTGKELAAVKGHNGTVNGIAWSADGTSLATASLDNRVKLWDPKDLTEKNVFVGHTDWVFTVAMFKHGRSIVSGSRDNTAKIWDVATGKVKFNLEGHASAVEAVAVSPDDKVVATASWDGTVKLWDADTGKEIGSLDGKNAWAAFFGLPQGLSAVYFVAFSRDGNLLATGGADGSVHLFDAKTRKLVANLGRHSGSTWQVAFTHDGKTLASGSSDKTAKLWDVATRKEVATLNTSEQGQVAALAYSPDARTVAIAHGRNVDVRDAVTGNLVFALTGHTDAASSVVFSPDGQMLASGSSDATIKIWDLAAGKEKQTLHGHEGDILALAFIRGGKKLASASDDGTIKLWDLDTGKELATLRGHEELVRALAVSPDGGILASGSGDGKIKLWDLAKDAEPRTLDAHEGGVRALAFSAGGQLASSGDDRMVKVWDVAQGKVRIDLTGHQGQVWAIAYSPGGSTLVSGGPKDIIVWDANTGHRRGVLKGHQDRVTCLAIHPHGKDLLSGSQDTNVLRWRTMSSTPPPITLQGTPTGVWFAVFSPAGDRLATGGAGGNITLWTRGLTPVEFSYPTGARTFREAAYSADGRFFAVGGTKEVFVFEAANNQLKHHIPVGQNVRTVAFSPDGKYLAAGTGDMGKPNTPSQTRVFELATVTEVMTLDHEAAVLRLLFLPDGKTLITSSMDKTRRLIEVPTGKEKTILRGHKGAARGMVLLPDGTLVTAGYDGSIRFWDIEAATEKRAALRPGMGLATLAASPDGTLLAAAQSAADDKGPAPLKVWDAATGKEKLTLQGHTGRILGVAFTHDGLGLIATGGELSSYGEISYWDLVSGRMRSNHKHGKQWIEMPVLSKDGRRVVSPSGNGLYLWDLNLTQKERSWEGHKSFTSCGLFLDQGRLLATGAADGTINVWNVRTGDRVGALDGHTDIIRNLAVLGDGKTLASSSGDKTIRLWDLTTLKHKATLEGNDPKLSVFSLAAAPDGKTLASGAGNFDWNPGELILWDSDTRKIRQKLPDVHAVLTMAYSPDGSMLAAGTFDGSVKVWDTKSNQLRATLKLPYARPVKFSPDGKLLVAAAGKAPSKPPKQPEPGDGRIRVWDTATWKERPTLVGHENVIFGVDVSPDGATIASAGQDGTIKLWQMPGPAGATLPIVVARRPDAIPAVGVNRLVGTGDVTAPSPVEIPETAPIRWRLWISLAVAGLLAVAAGVGLWRVKKRLGAPPPTQPGVPAQPTEGSGGAAAITFSCAGCGKQLKAKAELAGRRVKCPQCGKLVQVVATGITNMER